MYLKDITEKASLGSKAIFNGSDPYIIAEIGANHNGDMNLARKMIDSAKECGCDSVKFQSWTPSSLISKQEYDKNQSYDDSPKKHFGSLRAMVEKYYLRDEQHFELKEYCDSIGIDFCSTPFSISEANLLREMNVPFYKIASMDVTNHRLLRHVGQLSKPVLLSTGMATLGEIDSAVNTLVKVGAKDIVLLHCISIYPPKYGDINLRNIEMLRSSFGCPVGFSDHSIGVSIPLASVALGACVIEKHFTIDKDLPGWDHEISASPEEMKIIVTESRNIVKALGASRRIVSAAEQEKKAKFRRSIVSSGTLEKGHIIKEEDLEFKRPGSGIGPEHEQMLIGRTVARTIPEDHVISWKDLN